MNHTKGTKLLLNPPQVNRESKAFTLVELIVVVTILAILATIGFVSYSSYLTGVRDTNRISQLSSISDGLNLYSTKNSLPLPDDNVEVLVNSTLIAYQGTAGANTLETIDFTKGGIDPKDDVYFSYYVTKDRKYFQLMAFLEESDSLAFNETSPLKKGIEGDLVLGVEKTHAADYEDRYPTVTGKKLGILTDESNTPIQEIQTLDGVLDITSTTTGYIAHMTSEESITEGLLSINPKASCKRIKQMRGGSQDGVYKINPEGNNEFEVYCDMTTDGGGWTTISYTDDLAFQNHSTTGIDAWQWIVSDFTLSLSDDEINSIRAVSTEGRQDYVSLCSGIVTYYYLSSDNYAYAFAFRYHNDEVTPHGVDYSTTTDDIRVDVDGCSTNGGEGGLLENATVFEVRDIRVPIINVETRDNGSAGEQYGSPLIDNPAYLR